MYNSYGFGVQIILSSRGAQGRNVFLNFLESPGSEAFYDYPIVCNSRFSYFLNWSTIDII